MSASGAVCARYDYDPFGNTVKVGGDLDAGFGYTGHYRHVASGLYLAAYRAYDPTTARWTSRDPLGQTAGPNLYAYVNNKPVALTDPFGLYEQDVHYDLTRALAVRAGFTEAEASAIARADQGVDDNPQTSPFSSEAARRDFHFTSEERRQEMFESALGGDSLELLGQYLHAEQDSYSHQRGLTDRDGEPYGARFGHIEDGHSPDKTYLRPELAERMAHDTYDRLNGCAKTSRVPLNSLKGSNWLRAVAVQDR